MVTLLNNRWFSLGVKTWLANWGLHYSTEMGLTVVQVGPVIAEIVRGEVTY